MARAYLFNKSGAAMEPVHKVEGQLDQITCLNVQMVTQQQGLADFDLNCTKDIIICKLPLSISLTCKLTSRLLCSRNDDKDNANVQFYQHFQQLVLALRELIRHIVR